MTMEEKDLERALSQSPGYLLNAAGRMLRAKSNAALAPLKLSLQEYVIMNLVSLKVNLSQGSLGNRYGIDPTGMVDLIDKLEAADLVIRERNQQDRRKYVLRLTPKGAKVLAHARRLVKKQQEHFLAPLQPEEWELVRASLWKVIEASRHETDAH